ncbi:hypothetical protein PAV_1c02050 [Paenibacillus alvei DSM 29]|nr:hypothetical protein PAV_1c02050 [Paenibacillus alvei DSM 29]
MNLPKQTTDTGTTIPPVLPSVTIPVNDQICGVPEILAK